MGTICLWPIAWLVDCGSDLIQKSTRFSLQAVRFWVLPFLFLQCNAHHHHHDASSSSSFRTAVILPAAALLGHTRYHVPGTRYRLPGTRHVTCTSMVCFFLAGIPGHSSCSLLGATPGVSAQRSLNKVRATINSRASTTEMCHPNTPSTPQCMRNNTKRIFTFILYHYAKYVSYN